MVLCILCIVFFQLHSLLSFVSSFTFKLLSVLSEGVVGVSENFFMVSLLLKFCVKVPVEFVKLSLMFL
jgi:hypothetical protein